MEKLHRREVFWDEYLMDECQGVQVKMHAPRREEIAFVCDESWEGSVSGYFQIFRDGDIYRMYYRGGHMDLDTDGHFRTPGQSQFCYAESRDGIRFTRPDLGIVNWNGNTRNNILFAKEMDNIYIFRDDNPECPKEERYKGLCGEYAKGLMLYTSADGVHFSETGRCVNDKGNFDSLNTCFWNPETKKYELYYRGAHLLGDSELDKITRNVEGAVRDIFWCESEDFRHWTDGVRLEYGDTPDYQMYTNNVMVYPRAGHMHIGFPTRYTERRMDVSSVVSLPNWTLRKGLIENGGRSGTAMTDTVIMTSRDGLHFRRTGESYIRPGLEFADNWVYGDCYMAYGLAETREPVSGNMEWSMYATENYRMGPVRWRRYTTRLDGFFSWNGGWMPGYVLTKPVAFDGDSLNINFSTSAQGYVRIIVCDETGTALDGYDSGYLFGDTLKRNVEFEKKLGDLAGKTVRLRVELCDADLYSMEICDRLPAHLKG